MAETGWTKEWPAAKDSFHWMRWVDGRYRDLPVHVNGIQVMSLFDHSYQQRGNIEGQVEFLGPISPSDFEQLTRLRELLRQCLPYVLSAAEAAKMMDGFHPREHKEHRLAAAILDAIQDDGISAALREALAQRNTGGK